MKARKKGVITLIASEQSLVAKRNSFAYNMSKHALASLAKTTALDYASEGIRANAVCPGTIETPLYHNAIDRYCKRSGANKADVHAEEAALQPVGRLGQPEEVAAFVKFLSSDDAYGLPLAFFLSGGQVHDCKITPQLISVLPQSDYTIADRGYDSEELRELIRSKKSAPIIPRKGNSKAGNNDIDWHLYKYRHLVENIFARLKHFRAIATRYDKLERNYASMVALACGWVWLPM